MPAVQYKAGLGEFGLLRTLHEYIDPTLVADILRHSVIPIILALLGFIFQQDVRDAFARAFTTLTARR